MVKRASSAEIVCSGEMPCNTPCACFESERWKGLSNLLGEKILRTHVFMVHAFHAVLRKTRLDRFTSVVRAGVCACVLVCLCVCVCACVRLSV